MDFKDSPEQAAFRAEIRSWLQANATAKSAGGGRKDQSDAYEDAKAWYKKVADAGYACLNWPKQYGGAGLSDIHKVIWSQEVANYAEPDGYFVIGIGNCGPAIMHFATEEQKQTLLPPMASAETVWCQMFSEPSAGSDVAGLRTSAVADGDNWIINGQKIWTSGAQHSDYGVILCRTDPTISKYRGMTMFFIDMNQPGVEVKPIKQMDGGAHFNEVFFNNAIIPDAYRLGDVGGGWGAALLVLMNERLAIAGVQPDGFPEFLQLVKTLHIDGEPISANPAVRERLAEWYYKHAGIKASTNRMLTAVAKGGMPGAEAALGKLVGAVMNQDIADYAIQLLGDAGVICEPDIAEQQAHFQKTVLFSPGIRLAGGTDEVMRNVIAEQVLGLPQEPRADKGLAFNEIPSGNQSR
ncbi:acyl-CoA dehydrogenase family protein [uncultured Zhongshania sp.]|uniref:acyl-CoA dehydrogenase family protein n=1 Tax=uncultured Zhongshania sp. TaxID=1642288 RepID=UPI0030D895EF|tara:strand:- start:13204 stop:14430 length:1227 start_codon:yes stop_codon:yes gene_type:complete